jgi:phosphoribosylanthranilate isomerase
MYHFGIFLMEQSGQSTRARAEFNHTNAILIEVKSREKNGGKDRKFNLTGVMEDIDNISNDILIR